jgi:hypothetical protein
MVTPKHHGALVDRLVQETQPVRRLWSVPARMVVFLTLSAAVVGLVVAGAARPDFHAKLVDRTFGIELVLLFVATAFMGLLALRSAVPGRAPSRYEGTVAVALVVATALLSCAEPLDTGVAVGTFLGIGAACAARTFAFAALPWILLMAAIRRGAPTRVRAAGAYAGATALLLSTTILRAACPQDGVLHWLVWHFSPIAVGTVLSAAVASTWLRWRHA